MKGCYALPFLLLSNLYYTTIVQVEEERTNLLYLVFLQVAEKIAACFLLRSFANPPFPHIGPINFQLSRTWGRKRIRRPLSILGLMETIPFLQM